MKKKGARYPSGTLAHKEKGTTRWLFLGGKGDVGFNVIHPMGRKKRKQSEEREGKKSTQ